MTTRLTLVIMSYMLVLLYVTFFLLSAANFGWFMQTQLDILKYLKILKYLSISD